MIISKAGENGKMKNNKLRRILLILFILIIVLVTIGISICVIKRKENARELSDIDRISKVLSTTRKTDIFVRGAEVDFNDKVSSTIVDEISKSKISGSGDYKVIIVNDLDDEIELSGNEIDVLTELISKNNYMLIYLGEKYSTTWDDTSYGVANIEGNLCYIYYSWDGIPTRNIGAWNETDQETLGKYPFSLGETLLYSIEAYLQ